LSGGGFCFDLKIQAAGYAWAAWSLGDLSVWGVITGIDGAFDVI
jgi:hypothetical protein